MSSYRRLRRRIRQLEARLEALEAREHVATITNVIELPGLVNEEVARRAAAVIQQFVQQNLRRPDAIRYT